MPRGDSLMWCESRSCSLHAAIRPYQSYRDPELITLRMRDTPTDQRLTLLNELNMQVEVRTLCRPVKFLHTKLNHPCLYGPCFVHWCAVMLEQEVAIPKLFPQSWEHEIVQNVLVFISVLLANRCRVACFPSTPSPYTYSCFRKPATDPTLAFFPGYPSTLTPIPFSALAPSTFLCPSALPHPSLPPVLCQFPRQTKSSVCLRSSGGMRNAGVKRGGGEESGEAEGQLHVFSLA
ncbi:hypothetical protein QTP70_008806 [Hemibagrus guttatus]|uniref:Uncharacterized protein n=1 Tax=Hemibagrus guttatus TaxID=175788 RepID=A0AAE0QUD9_9TELE|nr:hypothetical protein QTP70_008806 [Hemibagrus guttatus]